MDSSTKPCPFCGEEIKAEAVKCRFCKQMLDAVETEPVPEKSNVQRLLEERQAKREEKQKSGNWETILLIIVGVGLFGMRSCFNSAEKISAENRALQSAFSGNIGRKIENDPVKVVEKRYLKKAEGGDVQSQIDLALYYMMLGKADSADKFLRQAMAGGSAGAKLYLANILIRESDPAKKAEGLKFLEELATGGDRDAKIILGELYLTINDITPVNPEKGFRYLSEEIIFRKTKTILGREGVAYQPIMDHRSWGLTPDFVMSGVEWSLEQHISNGMREYLTGLSANIHHFREFCRYDIADGVMLLGECYRNGWGTAPDDEAGAYLIERGKELLEQIAKKSPVAQYRLAMCYYYGIGVAEDKAKGMEMLKKSAEKFYIAENMLKELENERQK